LRGGEVIELASDLGGGKTTFTQGLAAAMGYDGEVTSPTFTLSNIYRLPSGREIHHYDLYRLSEGGILGDELDEDMGDPVIVTVVEWAGAVSDILPADRLRVELERTGDDSRLIRFTAGGPVSENLVTELKGDQS
jgi:tRNA threonylcarbamoyladenosine biosynthesis protein TsaE